MKKKLLEMFLMISSNRELISKVDIMLVFEMSVDDPFSI